MVMPSTLVKGLIKPTLWLLSVYTLCDTNSGGNLNSLLKCCCKHKAVLLAFWVDTVELKAALSRLGINW